MSFMKRCLLSYSKLARAWVPGHKFSFNNPLYSLDASTIDRGYNDYSWYKQLTDKEIFFVTRLKSNAKIRVLESRPVLKSKGLICDETIELTTKYTANKCPIALRALSNMK